MMKNRVSLLMLMAFFSCVANGQDISSEMSSAGFKDITNTKTLFSYLCEYRVFNIANTELYIARTIVSREIYSANSSGQTIGVNYENKRYVHIGSGNPKQRVVVFEKC